MIHTIEYLPTDSLIPYARNSRTHSDSQVAQIAGSIREFGFTNPCLIDAQDGLIAGHGRVLAALKLKIDTVPCIRLSHLTDTQRKAYVIADNKLALNSGWDTEMLLLEFGDLEAAEFDMELLGFSDEELAAMKPEDLAEQSSVQSGSGSLAGRFMIPPFSVLNAREGWWQDRKRAWLALGIKSELGRGGGAGTPPHPPTVTQNRDGTLNYSGTAGQDARFDRQRQAAAPGGSARPACDYSKKQRGNGAGRPING